MVTNADAWVEAFISAGCSAVTIHPESSDGVAETLRSIEQLGASPGLALSIDDPITTAQPFIELVDRLLIMGTSLGIKGAELDPATPARIRNAVALREQSGRHPAVFVDGGIRRHTVPELAAAGADGVIPGSLVLGDTDSRSALHWIASLSNNSEAR